VCVCSVNLL